MTEKKKRIHVIKRGDGWIIRNEKLDKTIGSIHKSKDEAIAEAITHKELDYDLIIHKCDGSVESWKKA